MVEAGAKISKGGTQQAAGHGLEGYASDGSTDLRSAGAAEHETQDSAKAQENEASANSMDDGLELGRRGQGVSPVLTPPTEEEGDAPAQKNRRQRLKERKATAAAAGALPGIGRARSGSVKEGGSPKAAGAESPRRGAGAAAKDAKISERAEGAGSPQQRKQGTGAAAPGSPPRRRLEAAEPPATPPRRKQAEGEQSRPEGEQGRPENKNKKAKDKHDDLPTRGPGTRRPQVRAVPPPLSEELKNEAFRKTLERVETVAPEVPLQAAEQRSEPSDFDLIINRLRVNAQEYMSQDEQAQENLQEGVRQLKSSYTEFLQTIQPEEKKKGDVEELDEEEEEMRKIDWQFWTSVVNNFATVAKNDSAKLEEKVSDGIPKQIRGIIWQLISNSKSKEIRQLYQDLLQIPSEHEKAIQRDISRTKFIPVDKTESLFNVLKAYSLFDPEVGYTQGMAFVTAPLLINVWEEADAFGLLIKLMKNYGLREFFLPDMPGLQLKLYEFDRLLEENSPQLYNHLIRLGIRSSMYATQWFLTLFAYKFPLGFVLRILDVIFVEGIESLLKFAVILMLKNESVLVQLKFDKLLDFLKDGLFNYYLKENVRKRQEGKEDTNAIQNAEVSDSSSKSSTVGSEILGVEYNINVFIQDAIREVKITPIQLRRYSSEYEEIHQLEFQREAQYEEMRIKNRQLQREVRKLEHDYTLLNREHIMLANELIQNRLKIETLNDENKDLKLTVDVLKRHLSDEMRKQTLPNPDAQIPTDLKEDLEKTMQRNLEVMNQNQELEDKVTALERQVKQLKKNRANTSVEHGEDSSSEPRVRSHIVTPSISSWTFKKPW
ncbi:AFL161Cp [Eremothecium gossypii ATCC 10895]|uniref:GTPase-activating protein GYP5 n=1 Tax=Eremothecium gossypii (strain ATCC 10895 / CBS 109.51 / FGSC 9923 / NRRL Y-1056) TaxID=284811 RepID=GYP5_EREGS|nr:AFL161Cp [Eremothecium gossypii ATCC 10895]Q755I4.2 RecName: Full=GTPase-activating protein GYP5 [Eremothecium gossypii ATCC 10895]AAS53213.2 AFL161Cp [Eremothecium gossypii ATCC 10895]AEY97523.1 FAFL161Cp [Eremothecium gossypii FDAG1]